MSVGMWTQVTAVWPETVPDTSAWHCIFEDHGVNGTIENESVPGLTGYLAPGDEDKLEPLRAALLAAGATEVFTDLIPEDNWAESWKQFFIPRRLGERIVVRPTWEEYESQPDDIVLVLDPGQAFGTGDHPTTRNCLVLLEGTPLQGKEIADIGCGSGILAIAAGQLGASLIHAVDVEGPSVAATAENAERNGVTLVVERGLGFDPLPAAQTYDVVVSNILSAALIALAPEVSRRLRTPGVWIISGIIQANWPDVRTAAERYGFRLDETREEGEWVTARFVR